MRIKGASKVGNVVSDFEFEGTVDELDSLAEHIDKLKSILVKMGE